MNEMAKYDDNHRAYVERGAVIKRLQETISIQGEECARRHEVICELQAKYDRLRWLIIDITHKGRLMDWMLAHEEGLRDRIKQAIVEAGEITK